jgi:hypothetical protein
MTVITRTEPDDSARLRKSLEREQGPTAEQRDPTQGFGARMGYGDNEDPTNVSFPFLRRIRRDHGVAMGLHYTESPPLRAAWFMQADDARAAAFADNLIRPIYGTTVSIINRFLWAGFSPAVKDTVKVNPGWTYMVDGEAKQVWDSTAVDALVYKPLKELVPEACRLMYDSSGRWSGIKWDQHYMGTGGFVLAGQRTPDIDLVHSFWATLSRQGEDGNPYGFPRCAYVAPIFHMYRYIWKLLAHAFENSADPGPEVGFPSDDPDGKATALLIGRRKRSGSTIAIPTDVYKDFQDRNTNIPKWKISYSDTKTEFAALQQFLGYLETLKFRALLMSEQSLTEGDGGSSSRNVAQVMSSQRDAAAATLMDQIIEVIMEQLVRPAMAINMPWYQGRLEMRTIGLGKEDDDVVRQIFQLAGQKDLSNFGIDLNRLADSKGFPMLDPAERERQRKQMVEAANKTMTPAVEPTQGRRALVTQTGFGEMVYHQLHDPISLSSRDDGDFVASLPQTVTWEDRQVVDAARELRSHLAEAVKSPEPDRIALAVDVQRCLYRAYDAALSATARDLRVKPARRDDGATELLDHRARMIVFEALTEDARLEHLAQIEIAGVRNNAVSDVCLLADVQVQIIESGPWRGRIMAPEDAIDLGQICDLRPVPRAPDNLEIRKQKLDGEHMARYDEDAGVVLLSEDIDPQTEADFMIALGDRMVA